MTARLAQKSAAKKAAILAKVGNKGKTPHSLAARLPTPDLITKAGTNWMYLGERNRRIVRRNAKG